MYLVSITYEFDHEPYGKIQTLKVRDLFIVDASNQYESIEKTKNFLLKEKSDIRFTDVDSKALETGRHGYMISGIIN